MDTYIRRVRPIYEMQEKVAGYRTVRKQVPRYVDQRVKLSEKVEWRLVDKPRRTSSSGGQGGLARVMPQGNGPAVPDEGGSGGQSQSGAFDWGAWKRADMAEVERAIVAALDPADRKFRALAEELAIGVADTEPDNTGQSVSSTIQPLYYYPDSDFSGALSGQFLAVNPPFQLGGPTDLGLDSGEMPRALAVAQAADVVSYQLKPHALVNFLNRQDPNVDVRIHYSIWRGERIVVPGVVIQNRSDESVRVGDVFVRSGDSRTVLYPQGGTIGRLYAQGVQVGANESRIINLVQPAEPIPDSLNMTVALRLVIDGQIKVGAWTIWNSLPLPNSGE